MNDALKPKGGPEWSKVLTWSLMAFWVFLLFRPGASGALFVGDQASQLRATYLTRFGWDETRSIPSMDGSSDQVELVMFSDYDCRFCAQTALVIDSVRAEFPQLKVGVRHIYQSASLRGSNAALAAVCAAHVGLKDGMHRLLYEAASLRSDSSFVNRVDAHIRDLPDGNPLRTCLDAPPPEVTERLQEDQDLVVKLRITQAPTLLLRGTRHEGLIDRAGLIALLGLRGGGSSR